MMTTLGLPQHNSLFFFTSKSIHKTQTSQTNCISSSSSSEAFHRTDSVQVIHSSGTEETWKKRKRVFLLDVNPICYEGNKPSSYAFGHWVSLFFTQVSLNDPVIAVLDGDQCNQRRRELLPSYKSHRKSPNPWRYSKNHAKGPHQFVNEVLTKCNVPVVSIKGYEADDVVATLMEQAVQRGYHAVIASPDKDFKQLISENVQIVIPLADLRRWSFYTLKHYYAQYNCDPQSDLSFHECKFDISERITTMHLVLGYSKHDSEVFIGCIMGDEVDGVPGIHHIVPAFGRKTAMKLVRKHGSLESLLSAAAVRTVGRPYAQEALTKHAEYLRRNYEVLALKRDVKVQIQEEWLVERDTSNDSVVLSNFLSNLGR